MLGEFLLVAIDFPVAAWRDEYASRWGCSLRELRRCTAATNLASLRKTSSLATQYRAWSVPI